MSYSTVEQVITQLIAFPGYYVVGIVIQGTQNKEEETSIRITLKPEDIKK